VTQAALSARAARVESSPPVRRRRRRTIAPYLLSAPAMALYLAFTIVPLAYSIGTSFFAQRQTGGGILGVQTTVFVWFDNYAAVLQDPQLLSGLGHVALYGVIAVPLTLGLALLFALLLDAPGTRLRRFGRTAIFVPYAVPGVVAALMWGFLYLPSTSPFSYITERIGLGPIPFLDEGGIYGAIANISVWGGLGFNMLVIYTALQAIPRELVEAAQIDGANQIQIALRIKVPLVGPALVLTAIFALLGALQLYGEPIVLQPMTTTITTTWAPLMTIYRNAFALDNLPAASAASVVLALGTALFSVVVLLAARRVTRRSAR